MREAADSDRNTRSDRKRNQQESHGARGQGNPEFLVGEEIMSSLKDIDMVAYVRFASVYRQFRISTILSTKSKRFLTPKKANNIDFGV